MHTISEIDTVTMISLCSSVQMFLARVTINISSEAVYLVSQTMGVMATVKG